MGYDVTQLEFTYELKTNTYDATFGNVMRPNCVLRYQQQAGEEQLEYFDAGFDKLAEKGLAFVVTNTKCIINRTPKYGEKVHMVTWNRGIKGAKFYRSYNWYNENEELLVESTTAFALVDIKNHRFCRPNTLEMPMPFDFDKQNRAGTPKRVTTGDESDFVKVGERKIVDSLIDANGHLNNAFYVDFLTDFTENIENLEVESFAIDFICESRLGETMQVYRAVRDDAVYFYGEHERGRSFRATCTYRKREQ